VLRDHAQDVGRADDIAVKLDATGSIGARAHPLAVVLHEAAVAHGAILGRAPLIRASTAQVPRRVLESGSDVGGELTAASVAAAEARARVEHDRLAASRANDALHKRVQARATTSGSN
jgi:hypothetical protein